MTREILDVRIQSPEGVAAGSTASFKLPIGRAYKDVDIEYSGVTVAQLNEIRVYANNRQIHVYSGTDRDAMNQFDGMAAAAGILHIPFCRRGLKERDAEEETAIHTGVRLSDGTVINSMRIEVDIDAAATAPVMEMHAHQIAAVPGYPNAVLHVDRQTRDNAGAGEKEIFDLGYGLPTRQMLNRVFFKPSAGDISRIEMERDNFSIFDRSKARNERAQADGERVPQSGYHVVDSTEKGYGGAPWILSGAQDFRHTLTMTAAAVVTVYSETIGVIGD